MLAGDNISVSTLRVIGHEDHGRRYPKYLDVRLV